MFRPFESHDRPEDVDESMYSELTKHMGNSGPDSTPLSCQVSDFTFIVSSIHKRHFLVYFTTLRQCRSVGELGDLHAIPRGIRVDDYFGRYVSYILKRANTA